MKHADWVTQYKRVFVGQSGEKLQELGPKHSDEQAASQFAQFIKPVDQSETLKDPRGIGGRSYLISEGYSTEVEIITQAEAWLLLGRAAHTTLPIP